MNSNEYTGYDGVGLAELVKSKAVTAKELVQTAIEVIEKNNDDLNAVVYKAYDEALETSVKDLQGPFQGVPFLMKDLSRPVKGWVSSFGSNFVSGRPAEEDGIMARRYREAGAVFLGATNTPEYGIPGITQSKRLGVCRNPWDVSRHAGGSSGGAAAAVASGMVPIAHGSDGGGSLRIPAACCGLVGLKPSRHRMPVDPDSVLQLRELIVDHVLCRTIRDCATILDATDGQQAGSPYNSPYKSGLYSEEIKKSPRTLRIVWSGRNTFGYTVNPQVLNALEKTAKALEQMGHDVRYDENGFDYLDIYRAMRIVLAASFAGEIKNISERIGRKPGEDDFDPLARRLYEAGNTLSAADAYAANQKMRMLTWKVLEAFETFDVYLTPTLGDLPPDIETYDLLKQDIDEFDLRTRELFPFTAHFNVTGQPSISLPLWQSEEGLPIGMLFTGSLGDEATLLRLSAQLERELPWIGKRAGIWGAV